ncbi:MAG: hypothetical protein ACQEQV_05780 [Fibrobacterota bacterium]
MSLSRHLQSPEVLSDIRGRSFAEIKEIILDLGRQWYRDNPAETEQIRANLTGLGISFDEDDLEEIRRGICIHYAEKIMALSCSPAEFSRFLQEHVDWKDAQNTLASCADESGILIATPHFGAVEFATPSLSRMGHRANVVLKFSTEQLSQSIRAYADRMEQQGDFAPINFIELGRAGTSGAMDMYAALRRKEVLFTVFDEETEYSRPVPFMGTRVLGGAGLDRLLKTAGSFTRVFTVFMLREEDDTCRMILKEVDLTRGDPIGQMYGYLEEILQNHLHQWYFLHEEVPFVK